MRKCSRTFIPGCQHAACDWTWASGCGCVGTPGCMTGYGNGASENVSGNDGDESSGANGTCVEEEGGKKSYTTCLY